MCPDHSRYQPPGLDGLLLALPGAWTPLPLQSLNSDELVVLVSPACDPRVRQRPELRPPIGAVRRDGGGAFREGRGKR